MHSGQTSFCSKDSVTIQFSTLAISLYLKYNKGRINCNNISFLTFFSLKNHISDHPVANGDRKEFASCGTTPHVASKIYLEMRATK